MEDYFQAKRRLFVGSEPDTPPPPVRIVNLDDAYGQRLATELRGAITFAVEADADYRARDVRMTFAGCELTLDTPAGSRALALPLPGRFNVSNALGALAAVHTLCGADEAALDVLASALQGGVRVPGRFEPVDEGQRFAALVDYAHTPDSLENVLRAARELAGAEGGARVLCVFGAGGDRDRTKRPLMGRIVSELADRAILTSDNPRSEDPEAIAADVADGALGRFEVELDRRTAIERALREARPGDVVVLAGRGAEPEQELAAGKIPFDDRVVAREILGRL